MTQEREQLAKRRNGGRVRARGFTLAELLVVILIIAILAALSTSAYLGVFRGSQERRAKVTLDAVSAAVQAYYNEVRDYPAMRFSDIDSTLSWPTLPPRALANADQSIAAMIYQLQYRSSAGDLLKSLPSSVLVSLGVSVEDPKGSGQFRQLYTIVDGWGNAIQYLRARPGVPDTDPFSGASLNNRVLLVSMGRDGKPGQEGTDNPTDPSKTYPNPSVLKLGKADDILVQVGSAR